MELSASADWDHRFGIPGIAKVAEGNGGLPKVIITARDATGEMYLHGAHVTSWRPRGAEEVLFVSSNSRWENGRAIRGGVPICFPWFGGNADNSAAPAHGVVRTMAWQLESIEQVADAVAVSTSTESTHATKQWTSDEFRLIQRATFGSELSLELVVKNIGKTAFRFEEALHSYFRVGHIDQTRLQGLSAVEYLDKTDRNRKKTQQGPIVVVSETDRVYLNTAHTVELEDRSLGRRISVATENSLTTVVWNPWIDKARSLADLGDAEWMQMACIETSNVSDFSVQLAPGEQHKMQAIVRLSNL